MFKAKEGGQADGGHSEPRHNRQRHHHPWWWRRYDRLTATGDGNYVTGDAYSMTGDARGGNDRLIGGKGDDLLVGDAQAMSATARGGDDLLWGDPVCAGAGGADTFLFAGAIGQDIVFHFRPDEGEHLELRVTASPMSAISRSLSPAAVP